MELQKYPISLDEIDQWLVDNFGILPGACSSTENLKYTTAKMVAEVLWPKKAEKDLALTWEDIYQIIMINSQMEVSGDFDISHWKDYAEEHCKEVLKRFINIKNEQRIQQQSKEKRK